MEIFELRYFLEVARFENIHRASERLRVSPASLSKAVARIEGELGTRLFIREGRNIRLTDPGKLLRLRASQILQLEESARLELSGQPGQIQVILAGPEVLLSKLGMDLVETLRKRHPKATFEFHAGDEAQALAEVSNGDAHLALVTGDVLTGLTARTLDETKFVTVVGSGHPLYRRAVARKTVPIEEVLEHPFVSPNHPFLGQVQKKQSLDGWRDDEFPRRVEFLTSSLKLLEKLVVSGRAIAYLPAYFADELPVEVLTVSGCPYTCTQKIKLVARRPKDVSWLNALF